MNLESPKKPFRERDEFLRKRSVERARQVLDSGTPEPGKDRRT